MGKYLQLLGLDRKRLDLKKSWPDLKRHRLDLKIQAEKFRKNQKRSNQKNRLSQWGCRLRFVFWVFFFSPWTARVGTVAGLGDGGGQRSGYAVSATVEGKGVATQFRLGRENPRYSSNSTKFRIFIFIFIEKNPTRHI